MRRNDKKPKPGMRPLARATKSPGGGAMAPAPSPALDDMQIAHSAQQATGVAGRVSGTFRLFNCGNEEEVMAVVAADILEIGERIAAPDAGPGAYRAVLASMGFQDIVCEDSGSSAGDWSGKARTRRGVPCRWWQYNRHPHFGFAYAVQLSG